MTIAIGAKGAILGMKEEITYGTIQTSITKCLRIISDSVKPIENSIHSGAIPGLYTDDDEFALGRIRVGGSIGFEFRYEGAELLLKNIMGNAGTLEVATFTVTGGSNDMIDFKEDAGAELHAELTAGTYKMGERGAYVIDATNNKIDFKEDAGAEKNATLASAEYATAALLAAQVKTQMESAGAGTYTITYSATTGKFTISVASGATTFQFLWKTGTSGSDNADVSPHDELGFLDTLDGVDLASDVSDYSTTDPSGTFLALVKTQMEVAGAGTYICTFSNSTKLVTIAVATGASATQYLWKTGVSGSDNANESAVLLLGFTAGADGTDGASDTSDAALVTVFDHTFTLVDDLPTGLSMEVDRDQKAFTVEGGKLNTLGITLDANGILQGTVGILGEDVTAAAATTFTLPTAPMALFHQAVCTLDAVEKIKGFSLNHDNKLKGDMDNVGTRYIDEPLKTGKPDVNGSITMDFNDVTEYNLFRAGTVKPLSLVLTTTAVIKTGFYYTITITVPKMRYTDGCPVIDSPGPLTVELPFKCYATDSSTREFSMIIRNRLSSIY